MITNKKSLFHNIRFWVQIDLFNNHNTIFSVTIAIVDITI